MLIAAVSCRSASCDGVKARLESMGETTCRPQFLAGANNNRNWFRGKGSTMTDGADRVRKIVVEHLNVDPEKVTEKASFIDDLGADSLDQVELVMAFEEEFSVEIPDDAAESIQTFGDAVSFLTKATS